jgi:hypothetical protein
MLRPQESAARARAWHEHFNVALRPAANLAASVVPLNQISAGRSSGHSRRRAGHLDYSS